MLSPRDDVVISGYLYQVVQTAGFFEVAGSSFGTRMPRADWKVVSDYEILLPLPQEQCAIVSALSDMDAEIENLETRLAKARQLKQGMMEELLTGRTRLI